MYYYSFLRPSKQAFFYPGRIILSARLFLDTLINTLISFYLKEDPFSELMFLGLSYRKTAVCMCCAKWLKPKSPNCNNIRRAIIWNEVACYKLQSVWRTPMQLLFLSPGRFKGSIGYTLYSAVSSTHSTMERGKFISFFITKWYIWRMKMSKQWQS